MSTTPPGPSGSAAKSPLPSTSTPQPQIQEFSIRVPKNSRKKHNVMRFNKVLKVDFKEWKHVRMERENNMKDFRGGFGDEELPKFGAGSEFGRDAREEARRKKFGVASRKYKSEDQPWILKANGKTGKKFKGVREGGISENAAYYVFTHAPDGAIEAFPLHEWYNFQPIQRYKALSAEEAEQEFNRRNKVMNYFNLMLRKRLRPDADDGEDGAELLEGEKKGKRPGKKEKELKISEMDEWMDSDDDDDDDSGSDAKDDKKNKSDEEEDAKQKKKNKKKSLKKKKKKKNASDDEAFEESDDGDEEGRECDYISDSSASDSELESQKEIKSVAEEDALRKLLASDEEDEDEEQSDKKDEEEKNEEEEGKEKDEKDKEKAGKSGEKRKDKKKSKIKKEDGSDSSGDADSGPEPPKDRDLGKDDRKPTSTQSSRSPTPTPAAAAAVSAAAGSSDSLKRITSSSPDLSQAKKLKLESGYGSASLSLYVSGSSESGITEDAVRRYLMRKPMTTTELLQKFKSKKTGLSSEQIVTIMTKILKNINPISQKIKGKMYFSIKSQSHQSH